VGSARKPAGNPYASKGQASAPPASKSAPHKSADPARQAEKSAHSPARKPTKPVGNFRKPGLHIATPAAAPVRFAKGATINRRASDRLRHGYLWVYASDVERIELGKNSPEAPPALIEVADSRGLLLGTALYSPASQIALRMISRKSIDHAAWLVLLEERLRKAIARRKPLLSEATDACRLVFSEADELPGIVIDKYGPLTIIQLVAKGVDSAAVRELLVRVLREEVAPKAILERPDARMRELEGLSAPGDGPLWAAKGAAKLSATEFHLNGLTFHFDANAGQKTGAFLDQRLNYAAAAEWAQRLGATGRALDVCTYQGGFALHLAKVCDKVTGIDASHASLEVAEQNFETNRAQMKAETDWVEGDAFQILRDWSEAHEAFDVIVLDPPAFAKSVRAVESALRGYKELNLRALKMLRPGGLLVTCSCSHHVGWSDLEGAVAAAATDAGRRVRLLERRGAAPDHPVVLNLAETEYLKCLVLEVE
jgi:23S rRNA (cytosine1962-C5)-methyltransferase